MLISVARLCRSRTDNPRLWQRRRTRRSSTTTWRTPAAPWTPPAWTPGTQWSFQFKAILAFVMILEVRRMLTHVFDWDPGQTELMLDRLHGLLLVDDAPDPDVHLHSVHLLLHPDLLQPGWTLCGEIISEGAFKQKIAERCSSMSLVYITWIFSRAICCKNANFLTQYSPCLELVTSLLTPDLLTSSWPRHQAPCPGAAAQGLVEQTELQDEDHGRRVLSTRGQPTWLNYHNCFYRYSPIYTTMT